MTVDAVKNTQQFPIILQHMQHDLDSVETVATKRMVLYTMASSLCQRFDLMSKKNKKYMRLEDVSYTKSKYHHLYNAYIRRFSYV